MSAQTQTERDILSEIIAIGEPGCYVMPGHISVSEATAMLEAIVLNYNDDWFDDLSMPRHTWMVVTDATDDGDWHDKLYREVYEDEEGAEPFTLIAVEGYWLAPWERKQQSGATPDTAIWHRDNDWDERSGDASASE